ncbi:MAG: esterase [Bacillota bacterium]|jgi:carboxylesterase|nr:esterase [Bacillota bacterium]
MQNKKMGCLVIHGFGGGLHEVESLALFLNDTGYDVSCPKLKGHTGKRQDMKKATYEDWINSAEIELIKLLEQNSEVVIIGFSMGGLIATNLSLKYDIKAIVTINTPIYFWDIKRVFINLVNDIKNRNLNNFNRYLRANRNSPPIALFNFHKILKKTKPLFKEIKHPFLVIQAMDDDTVRNKSALYIYNNICSTMKEIKFYDKGGHLILLSESSKNVILDVGNFLNKI